MSAKFIETIMTMWKKIHCKNESCQKFLAWSNGSALIFGGTFIQQRKTILLCNNCHRRKEFVSDTKKNFIKFMSESEINRLTNPEFG